MPRLLARALHALLLLGAVHASAAEAPRPLSASVGAVSEARLLPGAGGLAGLDAVFSASARLLYEAQDGGQYLCSGSLLAGGQFVLTAAHCADDLVRMDVQFGVLADQPIQQRGVGQVFLHPGWTGALNTGADLALLRLDRPVQGIQGVSLSSSSALGQRYLLVGYGATTRGGSAIGPGWADAGYAHYGFNTFDLTSEQLLNAWDGSGNARYGQTLVSDFDNGQAQFNTLQRVADLRGQAFSSGLGLGADEALVAPGDSGGGDFVWDGAQWRLAAVNSWGWQFCGGRVAAPSCDFSASNSASFGDLSGATALLDQRGWIESITGAVPEPAAGPLLGLGLLGLLGLRAFRRGPRRA